MRKKTCQQQTKLDKKRWNEQWTKKQQHCFPFSMRQRNDFFSLVDWKCAMRQINEQTKERNSFLLHPFHVRFKYAYPKKERKIAEVTTTASATAAANNAKSKLSKMQKNVVHLGWKAWNGYINALNWTDLNGRWYVALTAQKRTKDSWFHCCHLVNLLLILSIICYCSNIDTIEALLNCKIIQLNTINQIQRPKVDKNKNGRAINFDVCSLPSLSSEPHTQNLQTVENKLKYVYYTLCTLCVCLCVWPKNWFTTFSLSKPNGLFCAIETFNNSLFVHKISLRVWASALFVPQWIKS